MQWNNFTLAKKVKILNSDVLDMYILKEKQTYNITRSLLTLLNIISVCSMWLWLIIHLQMCCYIPLFLLLLSTAGKFRQPK